MEIVNKSIDDIRPYANNPRFNDNAVQYVAQSIKEFGFKVPIIIDKDGEIIAGHTRYKASLELGLKEVPCIVADDLSEEQVKAFRLADNKVSEKAEWNYELLDEELQDILNIDMQDFGFDLDINVDTLDIKEEKDTSIKYFEDKEIEDDIVAHWSPEKNIDDYVKNIIDVPTAKYQFNRLCQGYEDGYNISLLFNKHRLTTETSASKDMFYGIVNDEKYRKSFARYLIEVNNKCVPQSNYYKFIGIGTAGYQYVNEFQPYLARKIYKEYCKDGDKILNPCAGWGGRLIGLASCLFNDVEYVETDPSVETYNGLVKLKNFLRLDDNYKQYNLPFEELKVKKDYFDFVFTSPPYFDTEHYSKDEGQSYIKNNSYEQWKENFLYKMIDKIIYCMKPTGTCMLNVGNKKYPIAQDIKDYLKVKYNIHTNDADYSLDDNEGTGAIRSSEEDFLIFKKN